MENNADCKSAGLRLRWFESITYHHFFFRDPNPIPLLASQDEELMRSIFAGRVGGGNGKEPARRENV